MKIEKGINSKFDDLFKSVDMIVSNTAQRVHHIESHIDIPRNSFWLPITKYNT